jgi:hypothetical protein
MQEISQIFVLWMAVQSQSCKLSSFFVLPLQIVTNLYSFLQYMSMECQKSKNDDLYADFSVL